MRSSTPTPADLPSRSIRRFVLGGAFMLAMTIWLAPRTPAVLAQEAKPAIPAAPATPSVSKAPAKAAVPKEGEGVSATIDIRTDESGKKSVTIEKSVVRQGADPSAESTDDDGPILGVGPGKHGKRVRIGVFGDDHEYDSFGDFVHNEPALAAMVVGIVAIIFLSPVLAIALILGYRMRKARMLNETMLKLAEKGVVPPAEALSALAGNPASAIAAAPSAAPIYEQAKQIRRRAASSDLRKGVIMGGIGLGLTFFSIFDDGTPNSVGLVLLFVGIGYLVLWWFEERQIAPSANGTGSGPGATPTGPSGGPSGSA